MRLIDADNAMAEYIDREEALLKLMQDGCLASSIESIKNVPAADVAPVVRCKDCKHFREYITVGTVCTKYVKSLGGREVGLRATEKDDFCSYGERKNDE